MRFLAGMVAAAWFGAVSATAASDLPDSVRTCPVPAAELERARLAISSHLGADIAATCTLERGSPYVNMTDGKYMGIGGWELIARFRPDPLRDLTCSLILTSIDGSPYEPDDGPLPDCVHQPELCDITIGRDEAIDLAVAQGLDRDWGKYTTDLVVAGGVEGFVWRVRAHPAGALHDRVVVINAHTGAVALDYEDKPCRR